MATPAVISSYIAEGTYNHFKNRNDELTRRSRALEITAKNCKRVLDLVGVNINAKMPRPDLFDRNYFMVCNHMSYIDILVLSTCRPAMFVTSVEMEKTFFLGDMAKIGGSFFVDRVNRRKMKEEVESLKKLVLSGLDVFIFPEGTSTNGMAGILPFKKSLFRVPFQAEIPILPICLKYKTINNEPFSDKNCDRVTWHGDMSFAPHLAQFMSIYQMEAEVEYMEPVFPRDFQDHGELAQHCDGLIRTAYGDPKDW